MKLLHVLSVGVTSQKWIWYSAVSVPNDFTYFVLALNVLMRGGGAIPVAVSTEVSGYSESP